MLRISSEAILLRTVDFAESDRIVRLLVPESGRLTAVAKGARRSKKRFAGSLDLFNHLHVSVSSRRTRAMAYLEKAKLIAPFLGLRADSRRYALASYLLELLDRMAPEGGAGADTGRLFRFALGTLRNLDTAAPDRRLRVFFELRAFDALGLCPELGRCVRCGREPAGVKGTAAFHVADGGLVCRRCRRDDDPRILPVHLGTLAVLRRGLAGEPEQLARLRLAPVALEEAEQLLFRFQRFHVGIELRSERFLDQVFGRKPAPRSLTPARA